MATFLLTSWTALSQPSVTNDPKELKILYAREIIKNISVRMELDSCHKTTSDLKESLRRVEYAAIRTRSTNDSLMTVAELNKSMYEREKEATSRAIQDRDEYQSRNIALTQENQRRKTGGRIWKTVGVAAILVAVFL